MTRQGRDEGKERARIGGVRKRKRTVREMSGMANSVANV